MNHKHGQQDTKRETPTHSKFALVIPAEGAFKKLSEADHRPAAGVFCCHTVKLDERFSLMPEEEFKAKINKNIEKTFIAVKYLKWTVLLIIATTEQTAWIQKRSC